MTSASLFRPIAFYLPQFHPIPENDAVWGAGFTEWKNVTRARSLFDGHYQPHIPADLGFYDLRVPEVREAQAAMARQHGIYGFCYYHYWFNGRQVLERPLREVMASGRPDFPFCVCWANENWTRRWDGQESEIILEQKYSPEDDIAHIRALIGCFSDPRYITVHGKPLLLIYRLSRLPDPGATVDLWRRELLRAGFSGLYVCNVESSESEHQLSRRYGLDAAVQFAPDWTALPPRIYPTVRRLPFFRRQPVGPPFTDNYIGEYGPLARQMLAKSNPGYKRFPGVTPGWDNTARRRTDAIVLRNSTPEKYSLWLSDTLAAFTPDSPEENFLFINAWNEWAEGCHLEPCQKWGHRYLEATRDALAAATR